jgi:hypothetical protein
LPAARGGTAFSRLTVDVCVAARETTASILLYFVTVFLFSFSRHKGTSARARAIISRLSQINYNSGFELLFSAFPPLHPEAESSGIDGANEQKGRREEA